MIGWGDIYKVVSAMVPLYVALGLGYGSIRWWRVFTKEQSEGISRLVSFFTLPLFTFQFTLRIDPFAMNYRFLAADAVSKLIVIAVAAAWARCGTGGGKGSCCWAITGFSLSTLTNSLVVGVPLMESMYGRWSRDLVVQVSVVQAIVWLTLLLFALEVRKSGSAVGPTSTAAVADTDTESQAAVKEAGVVDEAAAGEAKPSFWQLMKVVWIKLAVNPNTYASVVGLLWAFAANRWELRSKWTIFGTKYEDKAEYILTLLDQILLKWHFEMPAIMEDSVLIMSKAGTGMAMFSMGLFMASQEKLITCGPGPTAFSMVLRFIAGPAATAIGAIVVGLRGDVLRVAIIQSALPQSITSFIFAREYGLHADVLSTAVIFGMLVSLPVLVGYYVLLGVFN